MEERKKERAKRKREVVEGSGVSKEASKTGQKKGGNGKGEGRRGGSGKQTGSRRKPGGRGRSGALRTISNESETEEEEEVHEVKEDSEGLDQSGEEDQRPKASGVSSCGRHRKPNSLLQHK
eukprot:244563-Pelagomonas_calceolata.AAC.1